MTNLPLGIAALPAQVSLTFSNRQYADNQLFGTANLTGGWTANALGIETAAPVTNRVLQANDAPRKFFRLAQVQYPSSTFAPKTMYGRTLTLTFTSALTNTLTIAFDSAEENIPFRPSIRGR